MDSPLLRGGWLHLRHWHPSDCYKQRMARRIRRCVLLDASAGCLVDFIVPSFFPRMVASGGTTRLAVPLDLGVDHSCRIGVDTDRH